jgi:hypothetical protein
LPGDELVKPDLAKLAAANTGSARHCQLALVSKLLPAISYKQKAAANPSNQRQLSQTQNP